MERYCVYLLAAGGGFAYAGSSGRVEGRLRRHFRGYSSAAVRDLRPDAAYVLACTRNRSLALAWETWLHKAHRPPYAARAPAERPRKPPHPPPGWHIPRNAVCEPSLPPPCGHERPANPPPELKPRAETWDGVRDGGPGAQEASAESARGFYLGGFACTDRLCPAAWAYDLQVQTCRFLTGVVRPVSLYLWGSTYVRGPRRTARGVKSLQFIIHSGIYHGHG
ncbi:MAG: GIY-YIG nuclease family protein [Pyrobaculum sp.]